MTPNDLPVPAGGEHPLARILDQFAIDSDAANPSMRRDRPYSGQANTDLGQRGATLVSGLTFRDLRDCFVRAYALSKGAISEKNMVYYREAEKGEQAALCSEDLYKLDGDVDPVAIFQNFACEVEKVMGIYPNIPGLKP